MFAVTFRAGTHVVLDKFAPPAFLAAVNDHQARAPPAVHFSE